MAVFDEAHKLKNRNAKIHEACCRLDTKLRYGLTGTAMQVQASTYCCYIIVPLESVPIQQKLYRHKKTPCLFMNHLGAKAKDV